MDGLLLASGSVSPETNMGEGTYKTTEQDCPAVGSGVEGTACAQAENLCLVFPG